MLLAGGKTGIDETGELEAMTPAQKDLAAQYPDRRWFGWRPPPANPGSGLEGGSRAADLIGYDVTGAHTGVSDKQAEPTLATGLDENPDPTKRAIYSGYKHLILRVCSQGGWHRLGRPPRHRLGRASPRP